MDNTGESNIDISSDGEDYMVGGETLILNSGGTIEPTFEAGNCRPIELASPKYYEWSPREDITTYELAKCFPIVTSMQTMGCTAWKWRDVINDLPEGCQRHFKIIE